eukprot:6837836-Pyramimonas_sp.AAC.1
MFSAFNATDQPDSCVLTTLNRARTPFLRLHTANQRYCCALIILNPMLIMGIREALATVENQQCARS